MLGKERRAEAVLSLGHQRVGTGSTTPKSLRDIQPSMEMTTDRQVSLKANFAPFTFIKAFYQGIGENSVGACRTTHDLSSAVSILYLFKVASNIKTFKAAYFRSF